MRLILPTAVVLSLSARSAATAQQPPAPPPAPAGTAAARPQRPDVPGPTAPPRGSRGDRARQDPLRHQLPHVSRPGPAGWRHGRRQPVAVGAGAEGPGRRADPPRRDPGAIPAGIAPDAGAGAPRRRREGDRGLYPQRCGARGKAGRTAAGATHRAEHRRRRRRPRPEVLRRQLRELSFGDGGPAGPGDAVPRADAAPERVGRRPCGLRPSVAPGARRGRSARSPAARRPSPSPWR